MTSPGTGRPTLILVPTEVERRALQLPTGLGLVALCGFGPVAAAARAAALMTRLGPSRVVLIGIAGTYDAGTLPVGSATLFESVVQEDVGASDGEGRLLGPGQLGLPQWHEEGLTIEDRLDLAPSPVRPATRPGEATLVSVASASGSVDQARDRAARHAGALAEDMEGFSVALAGALAGIPVHVVRGISNVAGDRSMASWKIEEALEAARLKTLEAFP